MSILLNECPNCKTGTLKVNIGPITIDDGFNITISKCCTCGWMPKGKKQLDSVLYPNRYKNEPL